MKRALGRTREKEYRGSIAILGTRGIPARYGGFETFAEELSRRLSESDFAVTVYCERTSERKAAKRARKNEDWEIHHGVELVYIKAPKCGALSTIIYDLCCLWNARQRFDVVYMLGYGAAVGCWIPRAFGTAVWINMDGVEWARQKWGWFGRVWLRINEWIATRVASRLIADARGIKEYLVGRFRNLPPISVIPYGATVARTAKSEAVEERGLAPGSYYLIVARLEPENHILMIVKGFLRSSSEKKLVVVGNVEPETHYIAKVKRAATESGARIEFMGGVYDREKLTALRHYCAAYFHGHSVGGTNPSLLEAMACGNIVVAHDNIFNREVLGASGLYFQTAKDIPNILEKIEKEEDSIKDIKAHVRRRIEKIYNWDRITERYVNEIRNAKAIEKENL